VVLGVTRQQADAIVRAFDEFVAQPLEANLKKLNGRDIAKRNPMFYMARGANSVEQWVDRVLDDKETSAIEGQIGTFLEEVARIVSGGTKPAGGADLQIDRDEVVELYAIQTSANTKNSGGRRADIEALKSGARVLRASKRRVNMAIAVLGGRTKSGVVRSEPDIATPSSDEFWEHITGIADFWPRLLQVSVGLSPLVKSRAAEEVQRIKQEALELYGDSDGGLRLAAVAKPPRLRRRRRRFTKQA
jgi:hypothetical protein